MKTMRLAAVLAVMAFVISLAACSKGSDRTVLAKINRGSITAGDLKKQLSDLAPQMQQAVVTDAKARRDFLDDLIGIELVVQEAKRLGLDKDADFKKNMEARKKEIEDYKKKLDQQYQDAARNELFNSLLKKEIGDKLGKVQEPTAQEVKTYYEQNKDKLKNSAGKQYALKEIEPQLKMRLLQERRREIYMAFAKDLRAKASVSVDEKALDSALSSMAQPKDLDLSNMKVVPAPK